MPIALKMLLDRLEAPTVIWYRFVFATAFLTIWLRSRGPLPIPSGTPPRTMILLAITILGFSVNNLAFLSGLQYISPTAAQVMIQIAPLLIVISGVVFFRESFGGLQWAGAPVLAGGILLFFHDQLGELFGGFSSGSLGIVYINLAALAWAACATAQKKLMRIYGSFPLMWMIYVVGLVLMTPFANPSAVAGLDAWREWVLLYCCATTVIGYGLFSEALKLWEASRVGAVVAVTPLFTWAFTLLAAAWNPERFAAEPIDGLSMAGACMVALGSALAALARKTAAPAMVSVPTAAYAPQAPAGQSQSPSRS